MEIECDEVGGCGTPFLMEWGRLREEIRRFCQYAHMLAPDLAKAGLTHRQFCLLWAMYYGGTRTVAVLAGIAGVDEEAALADMRALERDAMVTLEAPPTRFATPRVAGTQKAETALGGLAPVLRALEWLAPEIAPDPAHPWQGPPPRV